MLLTLGLFFIVADLVTIIWGRDFHTITPPGFLLESKVIFGHYYPSYRLAVIVVGVVIAVAAYVIFERTQLGAILRAAIEDHDMVAALGHNVSLVRLSVLLAGAALAAFAGVIGGPIEQVTPGVGNDVLLLALIVVVVGGLGSIPGAFVASLIIGEVRIARRLARAAARPPPGGAVRALRRDGADPDRAARGAVRPMTRWGVRRPARRARAARRRAGAARHLQHVSC